MIKFAEKKMRGSHLSFIFVAICPVGDLVIHTSRQESATVYGAGTLCRRAVRKKNRSSSFQPGTCWLFVEGVFEQPNSFRVLNYKTNMWIIVDSLDTSSGPLTKLITYGSQHFINTAPLIDEIFDELDPNLRLCFRTEESSVEHRRELNGVFGEVMLSYLENIAINWMSALLKMYMLRRLSAGVDSIVANVDVVTISPFGSYFDAYCHVISIKIEFNLIPMTTVASLGIKIFCSLSQQCFSQRKSFSPRLVDYSTDEVADGLQIEVHFILPQTNRVGTDSFILVLYLFQMISARVHGITDKLLPFFISLKGFPPRLALDLLSGRSASTF
ncbi:hypothetical protein PILCRDRAFT_88222 [Piloderma croceum F 1598]|uniref:Uncharacterized protein n=1 Tax=Piloderma croceum (strain F 1598) TaxID=765440 RepID=A0A0C3FGA2_PILCF|nr:hypothetical protein PILCRDRAFT_88222 [Piloderma croceum F 1598]